MLVEPVRWDRVSRALAGHGADWILDAGPGTDVCALTAENLRGHGARTLALASPEGRRRLTTPGASPEGPDTRYASLAPAVVELPGGRRHLDSRYARLTGRPPVILAGMTPTTADAPIVAAAANAGYMAELAGGGQPDRWTFERRLTELRELLEPGREVVFNTLLLDRHLWALHVGRDALLVQARRGGAPLAGLTVSAGIPEVEEAVALLDELRAAGLHLNAFKPGTVAQIRQVLAIADAAPQHTIAVHVEGGRGGGHHSWEELDELLLETYHELRRRENVAALRGRRRRRSAARRRPAVRHVVGALRRARDARRRRPRRDGGDGVPRGDRVAGRQGRARRGRRQRGLGRARRRRGRRDVGAQPARRGHPCARQRGGAGGAPARSRSRATPAPSRGTATRSSPRSRRPRSRTSATSRR